MVPSCLGYVVCLVGWWISYPDLQLSLLGVQPVRGLVVHGSGGEGSNTQGEGGGKMKCGRGEDDGKDERGDGKPEYEYVGFMTCGRECRGER